VLGDLAAELVAEDDRLAGPAEAMIARSRGHVGPLIDAVARVQVGPADPAVPHLDAHLPAAGHGLRPLHHFEFGVRVKHA
jgi:hypothetical protein